MGVQRTAVSRVDEKGRLPDSAIARQGPYIALQTHRVRATARQVAELFHIRRSRNDHQHPFPADGSIWRQSNHSTGRRNSGLLFASQHNKLVQKISSGEIATLAAARIPDDEF